jgi:hypothetical protein
MVYCCTNERQAKDAMGPASGCSAVCERPPDARAGLEKYDDALVYYDATKRLFEKELLKAEAAKCDLALRRTLKSRERNDKALTILVCAMRGFVDCALCDEAAQTHQLIADTSASIGRYDASAEFERQAKRTRMRSYRSSS